MPRYHSKQFCEYKVHDGVPSTLQVYLYVAASKRVVGCAMVHGISRAFRALPHCSGEEASSADSASCSAPAGARGGPAANSPPRNGGRSAHGEGSEANRPGTAQRQAPGSMVPGSRASAPAALQLPPSSAQPWGPQARKALTYGGPLDRRRSGAHASTSCRKRPGTGGQQTLLSVWRAAAQAPGVSKVYARAVEGAEVDAKLKAHSSLMGTVVQ